jgi:hypothetical protein
MQTVTRNQNAQGLSLHGVKASNSVQALDRRTHLRHRLAAFGPILTACHVPRLSQPWVPEASSNVVHTRPPGVLDVHKQVYRQQHGAQDDSCLGKRHTAESEEVLNVSHPPGIRPQPASMDPASFAPILPSRSHNWSVEGSHSGYLASGYVQQPHSSSLLMNPLAHWPSPGTYRSVGGFNHQQGAVAEAVVQVVDQTGTHYEGRQMGANSSLAFLRTRNLQHSQPEVLPAHFPSSGQEQLRRTSFGSDTGHIR